MQTRVERSSFRRAVPVVLAVVGAGAGAVAVASRSAAVHIQASPDPVPLQRLRAEPKGDEQVVVCPDGTSLRVVVAGEGPTVVLAHGIAMGVGEWSLVWDRLIERGYRVVAFDARGHGRSTIGSDGIGSRAMASDFLAVLDAVDAHDAVLVGHSMGGFLALAAVLEVPGVAERLRGLVLVGSFAGHVYAGAPLNLVLDRTLLRTGLMRRAVRNTTIGTLFGASFFGDRPSPAMIRVLLETYLAGDQRLLSPLLEAFVVEDRGDRLAAIGLPTVVVCGRCDRTSPPCQAERLAAGIPGAHAVWVEGKGHMLNWEAPEVLVDAVTSIAPKRATS